MIHVPLITPFGPDGHVHTAALEALGHEVLAAGAAGLVALGTTGEAAALDPDERAEILAVVGRVCRERGARFTAGVGAGGTRQATRELAALAELPEPPDAALVTVPSFTRPGESGVVAHFRALAAASPVPLLVYHVPHRTAQPLTARTLRELAAIPRVTGVKYAAGLDAEAVDLLGDHPGGFEILAGDDVLAPAFLALGAHGGILASAHLATARWAELAEQARAAEGQETAGQETERSAPVGGRRLGHRLAALGAALFREPNPAVIKAVLHARGRIPTPDVRLPLLPASGPATARALAALAVAESAGQGAPAAARLVP